MSASFITESPYTYKSIVNQTPIRLKNFSYTNLNHIERIKENTSRGSTLSGLMFLTLLGAGTTIACTTTGGLGFVMVGAVMASLSIIPLIFFAVQTVKFFNSYKAIQAYNHPLSLENLFNLLEQHLSRNELEQRDPLKTFFNTMDPKFYAQFLKYTIDRFFEEYTLKDITDVDKVIKTKKENFRLQIFILLTQHENWQATWALQGFDKHILAINTLLKRP